MFLRHLHQDLIRKLLVESYSHSGCSKHVPRPSYWLITTETRRSLSVKSSSKSVKVSSGGGNNYPNHSHKSNQNQRVSSTTESDVLTGAEEGEKNFSGYCAELVRKHEYESFLCTLLLAGEGLRSSVFAVRAFNVEIALIRDQVSQKEIGLGRLGFWRDGVNKLFQQSSSSSSSAAADIPRHPVVRELHRVLKGKTHSKKWFVNLMDARERVMNDAPFKNLEDLEGYCDKAVSPILYLGLETLGTKNVDVDHAASHLGKSIGLANFIRSIPYNAQRRRVLIPQELLLKHKLSQENVIRVKNQEGIHDVVFDIASQAHMHYEKAKSLKKNIVKEALPLLLIGTPTEIYLKRLQNCQFNPYDPSLNRRYSLLPLHLYYRKLTRSYY